MKQPNKKFITIITLLTIGYIAIRLPASLISTLPRLIVSSILWVGLAIMLLQLCSWSELIKYEEVR